MKINSTL
jgi:hypothetical protein